MTKLSLASLHDIGGTKNIDDDIDKLTQDVVELSLNEKDSGSNIDNSNEREGSSHAI